MNEPLTKEQCLEALRIIISTTQCCDKDICVVDCSECLTIVRLIDEHFDNPPLKFEELHEGMVIWDSVLKEYILLGKPFNGRWVHYIFGATVMYTFHFEENRFYRYQVKVNEDDQR